MYIVNISTRLIQSTTLPITSTIATMADEIEIGIQDVPSLGNCIVVSVPETRKPPFQGASRQSFDTAIAQIIGYDEPENEWIGAPFAQMTSYYVDLYTFLYTDQTPSTSIGITYQFLAHISGTQYLFDDSIPFGTSWGLAHAGAQRQALQKLALEHDIPPEQQPATFASLILREVDLCKLHHPTYVYYGDRYGKETRLQSLIYWHTTWIDQLYFSDLDNAHRGETVIISKQAIEQRYKNPFPGVAWIGFEGLDGSGKDTQAAILQRYLQHIFNVTYGIQPFPTDGDIGQMIRQALRGERSFTGSALQFLFVADRADYLALAPHAGLITTRHSASGIAYGSRTRDELLRAVLSNLEVGWANITIFVDVPVAICLSRITQRGKQVELFEKTEALERARANFHTLRAILPSLLCIDGMTPAGTPKTIEAIFREIIGLLVTHMPDELFAPEVKDSLAGQLDSWISQNQQLFVV